jgi:hypothetical protein
MAARAVRKLRGGAGRPGLLPGDDRLCPQRQRYRRRQLLARRQPARRPCRQRAVHLPDAQLHLCRAGAAGPALARRDILGRPVGCDGLGDPDGTWRPLADGHGERQRLGAERPLSDRLPEVAAGRSQRHGLRHGQRADRSLRSQSAHRRRARPLGRRLGARLHLHAGVRFRVLRDRRAHLQFRQSPDRLSKRHRRAHRHRHVLLVRRFLLRRRGGLSLQSGQPGHGRQRAAGRFPLAGRGRRARTGRKAGTPG